MADLFNRFPKEFVTFKGKVKAICAEIGILDDVNKMFENQETENQLEDFLEQLVSELLEKDLDLLKEYTKAAVQDCRTFN